MQQSLTATINDISIKGLKTALTKYVKVLTAQSQHQSRSKDVGATERVTERMTERVTERTAERMTERMTESVKDSKVLSCLNRLKKDMSAILQALKRREKKRE